MSITLRDLKIVTYADAHEELVEVDIAITVSVEESHQIVGLLLRDSDLDLAESRVELFLVDLMVAVEGVEVAEGAAKSTDRLCTASCDLSTNVVQD